MTPDPKRLMDDSSSQLARELLTHGREDAAGELVRQGAHEAAQHALANVLAGAGGSATLVGSSLAKWLGALLGVGVMGAAIAAWVVGSSPSARPALSPSSRPALVVPREVPEPNRVAFDDLPLAPVPSASVGPGGRSQPPVDALEREIGILDRARRSLTLGNPALALNELDEHARELSVLLPEAQSLRIEALYASGRRDEADALATRFLASHPTSPLAARVRALQHERGPETGSP